MQGQFNLSTELVEAPDGTVHVRFVVVCGPVIQMITLCPEEMAQVYAFMEEHLSAQIAHVYQMKRELMEFRRAVVPLNGHMPPGGVARG